MTSRPVWEVRLLKKKKVKINKCKTNSPTTNIKNNLKWRGGVQDRGGGEGVRHWRGLTGRDWSRGHMGWGGGTDTRFVEIKS